MSIPKFEVIEEHPINSDVWASVDDGSSGFTNVTLKDWDDSDVIVLNEEGIINLHTFLGKIRKERGHTFE